MTGEMTRGMTGEMTRGMTGGMTGAGTRAPLVVNAAWPPEAGPAWSEIAAPLADAGADGIGLPDSPRLFPDPLITTERILAGTSVALAGPCVLSTGLRHPAVIAAGLGALAAAHPGRVLAVLARGESAVRNEGLTPPRLADHLFALRAVAERTDPERSAFLLLGAASGPRTIAGSAAAVGGVLIDAGTDPEVAARAVREARAARTDARCWLFVRAVATGSTEESLAASATLLGSCAHRMSLAPDWYRVPAQLRDAVAELAERYDYRRHGRSDLVDTSPAADLVRERFVVTGDAAAVAERIAALAADADGVVLAGATGGLLPRLYETVGAVRRGLDDTAAQGKPVATKERP